MDANSFLDKDAASFLDGADADSFLEDEKRPFWDQLKQATAENFAGVGNTVDRAVTGAALGLQHLVQGPNAEGDEMYKALQERLKQREDWANPEKKKVNSTLARSLGAASSLPMGMVTWPLSMPEVGQKFLDNGETLNKALAASAIQGTANAVAARMFPGYGSSANPIINGVQRAITGAGINAAQAGITGKALEFLADNEDTKQQFSPTLQSMIDAGIIGAGLGAAWGSKGTSKPTNDVGGKLRELLEAQKAKETQSTPAPNDPGARAMQGIVDTQLEGWNEPLRPPQPNGIDFIKQQLDAAKAAAADDVIAARQRELELAVKRQTTLDMNAAERARQEAAPVPGLEEARAREIQDSIDRTQRLNNEGKQMSIVEDYGNNDPLARMPNMRVDENGIPIRADLSMEAQNLQNPLQRNLWGDELPVRTGDNGIPLTQALDQLPPGPAREQALAQLSGIPAKSLPDKVNTILNEGEQGLSNTQRGGRLGRGQRGVTDPDLLTFGVSALLRKYPPRELLEKFKGTFNPRELSAAIDNATDPKSRDRLFWMSPDDFHRMALKRNDWFMKSPGSDLKRESIREGLKTENGLSSIPFLWVEDGQVMGHEGRHRMDVFKEQGLDKVPVIIRDMKYRNESGALPYSYLTGEDGLTMPMPEEALASERSRISNSSQRGGVNQQVYKDLITIGKKAKEAVDTFGKYVGGITTQFDKVKLPDELAHVKELPGMGKALEGMIVKGPDPEVAKSAILAEGKDGPALWQNFQSGPVLTADKINSTLLKSVGRWIGYADKKGAYDFNTKVKPIEKLLSKLNESEVKALNDAMSTEQTLRARATPEQLKAAGLSDRALEAYTAVRNVMDDSMTALNAGRMENGLEPIQGQNAYYSSVWQGDWHMPIFDKEGNLAWYNQTNTKREGMQALKYLKEKFGDTLDLNNSKPEYRKRGKMGDTPKDVMSAYQEMLNFFGDSEASDNIRQAMEEYARKKGYSALAQDKHFKAKEGIRGYLGDRPWLSETENAHQGLKAQLDYLENAYKWSAMQESLANIRKLLTDPDIIAQQPNNVQMAQAFTDHMMGISKNMLGALEQGAAKLLGVSQSSLYRTGADLKTFTYLTQLGLSPGYMIATPLQAIINVVPTHMEQSGLGYKHSATKTILKTLRDFSAGMTQAYSNDISQAAVNKDVNWVPMSELGKKALQFAQDNGVIAKNIFDENESLGAHKGVDFVKKSVGYTISFPERVTRMATFLSFVHHLDASGQFPNEMDMFNRASELTDNAITSFRRPDRPLMVDKFGLTGQLGYTYKSFLFNQFNQWAKWMDNKQYKELGTSLGLLLFMGGATNLPLVSELDGLWDRTKQLLANVAPDWFKTVNENQYARMGIKGSMIAHLPELLAWGAASQATGVNLASRFSPQVVDTKDPLSAFAPVTVELAEQLSTFKWLTHPNTTTATQGVYDVLAPPLAKGMMETHMPIFKGAKRDDGQAYIRPKQLESGEVSVVRTPQEEKIRQFGVTALSEAQRKTGDYLNNMNSRNMRDAREASLDKMWDAIRNGRKDDIKHYGKTYFELEGNSDEFNAYLAKKIPKLGMTPQEYMNTHANTFAAIMNVARRQEYGK